MYLIMYRRSATSRHIRCYEYLEHKDRAEKLAEKLRLTNVNVWVVYVEDPRK